MSPPWIQDAPGSNGHRRKRMFRFNFLLSLQMVVDESTICLMSQERKLVLDLIMKLAKQVSPKSLVELRNGHYVTIVT